MKFKSPHPIDAFRITSAPAWPSVAFETDATGPHTWRWTISWGTFTAKGTADTTDNKWNAKSVTENLGGTLTVAAEARDAKNVKIHATISVKIKGDNPSAAEINAYLATRVDGAGFDKIVQKESKFTHFNLHNEPIRSFDGGYGLCQLTTPKPTYEQVWNWKLNIDGGLALFKQKRAAAITYLSQSGRTYTPDQLTYEAVCRWNGGHYHEWDAKALKWVRPSHILCDSSTGNIGWDMNDAENKDKTEAVLRKRDSGSYSSAPAAGAHWRYSGICYADRLLD